MKNMLLMASMLVVVSLQGMDEKKMMDENSDTENFLRGSNKDLPKQLLKGNVFEKGTTGLSLKKGTLSLQYQQQGTGTLSLQYQQQGTGKFYMFECPVLMKDNMLQDSETSKRFVPTLVSLRKTLYHIDVTSLVDGLPNPVKFPGSVNMNSLQFVGEVLAHAHNKQTEQVVALIELLQGEKQVMFVRALDGYVPQEMYVQITQKGSWAPVFVMMAQQASDAAAQAVQAAQKQITDLTQQLANIAKSKEVKNLKAKGKQVANTYWQIARNNKVFTLASMGFGGALVYLLMLWKNR